MVLLLSSVHKLHMHATDLKRPWKQPQMSLCITLGWCRTCDASERGWIPTTWSDVESFIELLDSRMRDLRSGCW